MSNTISIKQGCTKLNGKIVNDRCKISPKKVVAIIDNSCENGYYALAKHNHRVVAGIPLSKDFDISKWKNANKGSINSSIHKTKNCTIKSHRRTNFRNPKGRLWRYIIS